MKRNLILAAALTALLGTTAAFAVNPEKYPITPDLDKQNAETFDAQATHIRQEMEKGGRYEFIKDRDREAVLPVLGEIGSQLRQETRRQVVDAVIARVFKRVQGN